MTSKARTKDDRQALRLPTQPCSRRRPLCAFVWSGIPVQHHHRNAGEVPLSVDAVDLITQDRRFSCLNKLARLRPRWGNRRHRCCSHDGTMSLCRVRFGQTCVGLCPSRHRANNTRHRFGRSRVSHQAPAPVTRLTRNAASPSVHLPVTRRKIAVASARAVPAQPNVAVRRVVSS